MKCSFCHHICSLRDSDVGGEIWVCYNHPHTVKELISFSSHVMGQCEGPDCCPQRHHTSTVIMYNDYKAKFRRDPSHNFCIYGPAGTEPVFRLSFHPDLTPENIEEKLPLWITFS